MTVDSKVIYLLNLMEQVMDDSDHRDTKEFMNGYLNGMEWFCNYRGGNQLQDRFDELVDQAADINNIYCFDYQLKQLIKDRFDYWLDNEETISKDEISKRIDHLTFIYELEDRQETIDKIYDLIN